MLKNVAADWNISNIVTAVVTDNAANMIVAIRKTDWRHIACFAHTINLFVQKGIATLKEDIVDKVKAIVE